VSIDNGNCARNSANRVACFIGGECQDTIADLLSYVQDEAKTLLEAFRINAEQAVKSGRISIAERQAILECYKRSLQGYGYDEA
jgi:arginine decarboxylase-like protein